MGFYSTLRSYYLAVKKINILPEKFMYLRMGEMADLVDNSSKRSLIPRIQVDTSW